jgi:hypothetical protein
LSVCMCQHGCSVPQSVRGEALTVGVVVSERGEEVGEVNTAGARRLPNTATTAS